LGRLAGGASHRRFDSRELSLIVILSSLGGAASVPIGYLGDFLGAVPWLPLGSPQLLSGLHVLWIVLASVLVGKRGTGALTGVLKGLVEVFLFSFHSVFALLISALEGLVADAVLAVFRKDSTTAIYLSGGLSSASNVAVVQFLLMPHLPQQVLAFMYLASFVSGLLFSGFIGKRVLETVQENRSMIF